MQKIKKHKYKYQNKNEYINYRYVFFNEIFISKLRAITIRQYIRSNVYIESRRTITDQGNTSFKNRKFRRDVKHVFKLSHSLFETFAVHQWNAFIQFKATHSMRSQWISGNDKNKCKFNE